MEQVAGLATGDEAGGADGEASLEVFLPGCEGAGGRGWKLYLAATVHHVAIAMAMTRFADGREAAPDFGELVEQIDDSVDKRKFRAEFARAYCAAVESDLTDWLGIEGGLRFERVISRKGDVGGTGVIVAKLPPRSVRALLTLSACDGHATLDRAIRHRFGRDGGSSERYAVDVRDWVDKPLRDWDGEEVGVLLATFVELDVDRGTMGRSTGFDLLPAFRNSFSWRRFERRARFRRLAERRRLHLLNRLKFH